MSAMSLLASRFAAASASPVTRDKSSRVDNDFTPMLSARQVTFSRAMTSRITLLGFLVWVPSLTTKDNCPSSGMGTPGSCRVSLHGGHPSKGPFWDIAPLEEEFPLPPYGFR